MFPKVNDHGIEHKWMDLSTDYLQSKHSNTLSLPTLQIQQPGPQLQTMSLSLHL